MLKNYLMVFFVSMVPVIELRGAIPIGLGMGLPALPTYLVCVLGNMLPVALYLPFCPQGSSSGATTSRSSGRCGKFFITKGEKGGPQTGGKGWQGSDRCPAALCGDPAARHRCLDRHAGSLHSGHEVQGCSHCLHGRCAAGGHHHGSGQRRAAGRGQRAVCGRLTKRGRFCRVKCR